MSKMNTTRRTGSMARDRPASWPRNGAERGAGRVRWRLGRHGANHFGEAERWRRQRVAWFRLDVHTGGSRQLLNHPAGLFGIVDQLDVDVEQLEQRFRIVGAGLGEVRLDLRPELLETAPVRS